ncbi:MAG: ZIP family metal transporter [Patescibacteria group bacterium]
MITMYSYVFLSIAAVSVISLIGVFLLSLNGNALQKYVSVFISLAVGALLGDAFIHLIPEALENSENASATSILIVVGILSFFVLEKILHWHHHGEDISEEHIHPVGKLVLLSDVLHNFIDGIIIAASFTVSIPVGIATTIAVILHEIPQEIGDFAVLLHAGYTKAKAIAFNFFSALSAFLGAGMFFFFDSFSEVVALVFVPIAAGGFVYIAVADLIPELHKTKHIRQSVYQFIALLLGLGAMVGLIFLE